MKKILSLALAVMMLLSVATVASAAESTMTITTTVPEASYTMNIPADMEIPFGTEGIEIGKVTISDASGFAMGKNLRVIVSYDGLLKSTEVETTIPYRLTGSFSDASLSGDRSINSGDSLVFMGNHVGTVGNNPVLVPTSGDKTNNILNINILIDLRDWGQALAGTYKTTITFASEVFVEPVK